MSPIVRTVRDQIRPADVDRLVTILAEGGLAVIPTDTVYGLIGRAFDHAVLERLDSIKGERRLPYAAAFASLDAVEEWLAGFSLRQRRVAQSLLPGPVTLVLPAGDRAPVGFRYGNAGIGIRVSAHPLLPELVSRLGSPIWATSANRSGEPAPGDFRAVRRLLVQAVDIAIDAGPTAFRDASTVVDLRTSDFGIIRRGPWASRVEGVMKRSSEPLEVLAVCSGNICRSPLAAALLQAAAGDPQTSRLRVSSAGMDAIADLPATREMVEIAFEWGLNISDHRARSATIEMLHKADLILVASPQHRQRIITIEPRAVRKTYLMGEIIGAETIPDPYQLGGEAYRRTAELLRSTMEAWAERLGKIALAEFGSTHNDLPEVTAAEPGAASAPTP